MLDVLYEAMITGSVSSFEALQSERILIAKAKGMALEKIEKPDAEEMPLEEYVAQAERIARLRDRAEDSAVELAEDVTASFIAHEFNKAVAEGRYGDVIQAMDDLSARIEDNVASHFVELQPPARLEEFAVDDEGRVMLHVLYDAIITGGVTPFERLQADRILEAEAKTSRVPTGPALKQAFKDPPIFPLETGWDSTATIVAELLPDHSVKVFYDTYIGATKPKFSRELGTLYRHFGEHAVFHGMILDPDALVVVKLYDQGEAMVPVPAIKLIDFFNQQKHDTLEKIKSVAILGATIGVGGVGAGGILGWADTITFAISAGSLFVNAYRKEIAKTRLGRLFLEAWDVAEGIAEYYNWARLGVDGLRLVHAKVSPAFERWRQEAPTSLSSAERQTIAKAQQHTEAWLDGVKKAESAEAVKYVEAHPPKKVEGEPGSRHAEIEGGHQVKEVSGGLGCKLYSGVGTDLPCPPEFQRAEPPKPAEPASPTVEPTEAARRAEKAKPEPHAEPSTGAEPTRAGEPAEPVRPPERPPGQEGAPHGAPPSSAAPRTLDDLRQQAVPLSAERDRLASRLDSTEHRVQDLREKIDEVARRREKAGLPPKPAEAFETELKELEAKAADQLRELELAKGKLAEVESEIQKLAPPAPSRPTPRQSEIDVGRDLGPKFKEQQSYFDGEEVPYGTEGSVRPDWVATDGSVSVEVKNYDVSETVHGLIDNVASQATYRAKHLPIGMRQKVVIDIRGQVVEVTQRNAIIQGIVDKSRGVIRPEDIKFKE
jgi:hypothetical protein